MDSGGNLKCGGAATSHLKLGGDFNGYAAWKVSLTCADGYLCSAYKNL